MDTHLRDDEEFVMRALAARYSGEWKPGENPPDAYLQFGDIIVAVEISTLTQHIIDDDGRFIPRLSHDSGALSLIEEVDDEIGANIPKDISVFIHLKAPIRQRRRLKPLLINRIMDILCIHTSEAEIRLNILLNEVTIKLLPSERPSGKKVVGFVSNQKSSTNILENAQQILDNRIGIKTKKCQNPNSSGQKWLVLLNDYWLADENTYKQAIGMSLVEHTFDKILLVSGNKSVVSLYGN